MVNDAFEVNDTFRLNLAKATILAAKEQNSNVLNLLNHGISYSHLKILLPFILEHIPNLVELDLSKLDIEDIPDTIKEFTALETLTLEKCNLDRVPTVVYELKQLKNLNLAGNNIKYIDDRLGNLDHLEKLDVSRNALESLPITIPKTLLELSLKNNKIRSIPEIINQLVALEKLDLSNNILSTLTLNLDSLTKLDSLILDGNYMTSVPEKLLEFEGTLSVKNNLFTRESRLGLQNLFDATNCTIVFDDTNEQGEIIDPSVRAKERQLDFLSKCYPDESSLRRCYLAIIKNNDTFTINDINERNNNSQEQRGSHILKKFIVRAALINERQEGFYIPEITYLLNKISANDSAEANDTIAEIATALGNCNTPIEAFLITLKIQLNTQSGMPLSEEMRTLIEREAIDREINRKLGELIKTVDKIEVVNALVNLIYLSEELPFENKFLKIEGERFRLPSRTENIGFGYEQITPELAKAFAELVCKDKKGLKRVIKSRNYELDSDKIFVIYSRYMANLGNRESIDRLIKDAKEEVFKSDVYRTLIAEYFSAKGAKELIHYEELEATLYKQLTPDNIAAHPQICQDVTNYFLDKIKTFNQNNRRREKFNALAVAAKNIPSKIKKSVAPARARTPNSGPSI